MRSEGILEWQAGRNLCDCHCMPVCVCVCARAHPCVSRLTMGNDKGDTCVGFDLGAAGPWTCSATRRLADKSSSKSALATGPLVTTAPGAVADTHMPGPGCWLTPEPYTWQQLAFTWHVWITSTASVYQCRQFLKFLQASSLASNFVSETMANSLTSFRLQMVNRCSTACGFGVKEDLVDVKS